MNATAIKLVIKFWHDDQAEDPCDGDNWKVYSFSNRHSNHADPEDVGFESDDDGAFGPGKDLKAKLDTGLAFMLDYYEHGQCMWSLAGEGTQCRWDTSSMAGLLVWEGDDIHEDTKIEERTKWANGMVEMFTEWCNGNVFGYTLEAFKVCECCKQDVELTEEETDLYLPSCGGYYGSDVDGMVIDIKDQIGSDWANYEVAFKEENGYGIADEAKRLWEEAK